MPLVSDRAICLRKTEYSETSQVVTLLTQTHGLVRAIVKGAHRQTKAGSGRFDGGLDLLDEGTAQFTDHVDRDLNTLTEWRVLEGHRQLRRTTRSMFLGLYLAELVSSLFEPHDPHPGLFERLNLTLSALGGPCSEPAGLAMALEAVREAGLMPMLGRCVNCQSPANERGFRSYSLAQGGVLCPTCAGRVNDAVKIDPVWPALAVRLLKLRRESQAEPDWPEVTPTQIRAIHRLLMAHLRQSAGLEFRLKHFLVGV
jgi:DNA repair protein RecO (recombination protein O)